MATHQKGRVVIIKRIGFWGGVCAFIALCLLPTPAGLSQEGWFTLALLVLMVSWWVSEALPIGVTSLLPLVIVPLFGIGSMNAAAAPYASSIIFLLMGGFIIGKSVERWNLHERIALGVLSKVGTRPTALIAGFMLTAALLSMWISNTATAIMLLPIVLSVAARTPFEGADKARFTIAALLGTAWAASIGGIGTPVGTTPNLIIIGFLEESGDASFTFLKWMSFGVPVMAVMLPAAFFVITKWGPKISNDAKAPEGFFTDKLAALGKMRRPEKRVTGVFLVIAFFWIFRQAFIQDISVMGLKPFAGLNDSMIAIAGVIALFIVPSGSTREPGSRLLDWPTAAKIPWDILLLFGGGLSLAAMIQATGLSVWLGGEMSFITGLPPIAMTLLLISFVIFFTELTSNTATTAALMPIVAAIALETGTDPAQLAIPIAMAASCAFMLPMATGPNAVIFGSGQVTMGDMAKAGFKLNLLGIVLITAVASIIVPLVL
ncbi:SLC13 family permease [Hellea sp.]|nr:SLC13 family permease [Hellea sp.]